MTMKELAVGMKVRLLRKGAALDWARQYAHRRGRSLTAEDRQLIEREAGREATVLEVFQHPNAPYPGAVLDTVRGFVWPAAILKSMEGARS